MADLKHCLPGVSAAGFISEQRLRQRAATLSDAEFAATYGAVPALLMIALCSGRIRLKDSRRSGDVTTTGKWGSGMRYHNRIAFLAKRPGNPFGKRITVGRAPNNDIVIDVPTISKFQAFFEREGDRWTIVPLASVNGTYVNGDAVAANEGRVVTPGDVVTFGAELEGTFIAAGALHARLKKEPTGA
jgi:hypothetical protein